jgi:hypothetical protein
MVKRKQISKITPEEHAQMLVDSAIRDKEMSIERGIMPLNPTRKFNIGDRVHLGAHHEVYVRQIYRDGLYYLCEAIAVQREKNKPPSNEFHVEGWFEILPYGCSGDSKFRQEEDLYIRQSNSSLDSLLFMVYGEHAGVDFNADYQREHVWTLDDKVALIDSIFNNVDIGKFLFTQRRESHPGKYYEVIDGKQRLTALCEFYEDRFQYKGYYFSQLSPLDKNKFLGHGISYGTLENPTLEKIYKSFIKMNTCGKPMDHKHIEKVQKLLNELK